MPSRPAADAEQARRRGRAVSLPALPEPLLMAVGCASADLVDLGHIGRVTAGYGRRTIPLAAAAT